MSFKAKDWVVVRSREEILATLDDAGELDKMPFMPEMLELCGTRLRVSAVAHKTCDVACKTGGRRLDDTIHLDNVRCDGSAHGGCEAGCLVFWKTQWLKPADDTDSATIVSAAIGNAGNSTATAASKHADDALSQRLHAATVRTGNGETIYSCQATRLFDATRPLKWWEPWQYVKDLTSGNVRLGRFLRAGFLRVLYHLRSLGIGYRAGVAVYDIAHRMLTGRESPHQTGVIPAGQPTPTETLNLKEGEWVVVRPLKEIRKTITEHNLNRGMRWDPEMAQFCGKRFKVAKSVDHIVDERHGKMLKMRSPCIILDGVVCSGDYSGRRMFCPRKIYPYFREIWLRRLSPNETAVPPR
jgi:hypothetical protein